MEGFNEPDLAKEQDVEVREPSGLVSPSASPQEQDGSGVLVDPVRKSLSIKEMAQVWRAKNAVLEYGQDFEGKQSAVDTCREDLKACQDRLEAMRLKRDALIVELEHAVESNNHASRGLLESMVEKATKETDSELAVEMVLREALKEAELSLLTAELNFSKHLPLQQLVVEKGGNITAMKEQQATGRLKQENALLSNYVLKKKALEKKQTLAQSEGEALQTQAAVEAKRAGEVTHALMEVTVEREQARKTKEDRERKEAAESRLKAMLELKQSIAASKEKMKKKVEGAGGASEAPTEGEVAGEDLLVKKKRERLEEFTKKMEHFDAVQRDKEMEIVQKLLNEERRLKRQQEKLSKPHWQTREVAAAVGHGPRKMQRRKREEEGSEVSPSTATAPVSATLVPGKQPGVEEGDRREGEVAVDQEEEEEEERERARRAERPSMMSDETLIRPEFDGLWSAVSLPSGPLSPGEGGGDLLDSVGGAGAGEGGLGQKKTMSKMEKDILLRNLQRQKETITHTQVVAGREFKGPAYRSTPEVVEFKDFVVGKEYKCVLQLTNISYTVNTCKFLGVSENLKDFLSISFTPPGLMSAGIACTMAVVFEPMIDDDTDGEIEMMAQTGPFSVPVRCRRKRCAVSVSESKVDFSRVCRGESRVKKLTLRNIGALGTELTIRKCASDVLPSDAASKHNPSISPDQPPEDRASGRGASRASSTVGDASQPKPPPDSEKEVSTVLVPPLEGGEGEEQEGRAKECKPAVFIQEPPQGEEGVTMATSEAALSTSDSTALLKEEEATTAAQEQCPTPSLSPDISIEPVSARLEAYSELVVAVHFSPSSLGEHAADFVVEFSSSEVDKVDVEVCGVCVDIPVSAEREVTDFGICELDKIYQDSLVFSNSSSAALQMSFDIPQQYASYLDVLPKQAVIQPNSSITTQLRFLPKSGIPLKQAEDGSCHGETTSLFSTQVLARVANQVLPVVFAVRATLTPSALEFSVKGVDFGCVGFHESVLSSVEVTNTSALVQEIGFVNTPNMVEVQPADGFLTMLPLETLKLDVIVAPDKVGPFSFKLTCVSGSGRKYSIPCKGRAVQPPLSLTHNVVYFGGTPVNSASTARTNLIHKQLEHTRGGAMKFEFCLPSSCPVTVSPRTGVLAEGQSQAIQVQFCPKLKEEEVAAEAARLAKEAEAERCRLHEERARQQAEAQRQLATQKKSQKQSSLPKSGSHKASTEPVSDGSATTQGMSQTDPSLLHSAAEQSLIAQFAEQEMHLKIPCFVCTTNHKENSQRPVPYKLEDTVYLEVHGQAVRPSLVVASGHGQTKLDFGDVTIGERTVKEVYLKNISDKPVDITSPLLDPTGPFCILNAFRRVEAGALHRIAISFAPIDSQPFFEPICLGYHGNNAHLKLLLVGRGIPLKLVLEGAEGGQLDYGHTLAGDTTSKKVKLNNQSTNPVTFSAALTSCSAGNTGVSNFNGSCAFECAPARGQIAAGATEEVTFTFSPDHQSVHYQNKAHIHINSKENVYQFLLKGRAWEAGMYATTMPDSAPSLPMESLCPQNEEDGPKGLVLTFIHCLKEESVSVLTQLIEIGGVKSPSLKKNGGEYSFEAVHGSGAKYFAFDSMKGSVEGGGSREVKVSFTPPKGEMSASVEGSTMLTLKGESTVQYKVLLRGVVME